MSINAMHTDFLAFLPVVIDRLKTVSSIKKVFTIKELGELDTGKQTAVLDGCVYVVLDGFTPADNANKGKNQTMNISFSVLLAKQHYTRSDMGDVGVILTAICQSLMGFEPQTDGRHLTISPIYLDKGASVLYQKGFGLYPLRFKTQSVIIAKD